MNHDPVAHVLERLQGVKPAGDGRWSARCPAHADRRASLSVARGEDGRVLLHCFAGCTTPAICKAIGIRESDLFPRDDPPRHSASAKPPPKPKPEAFPTAEAAIAALGRSRGPASARWEYTDAKGEPWGYVLRWNLPNADKDILPVSRDLPTGDDLGNPAGVPQRWRCAGMPTPRLLYALPDIAALRAGSTVYVAEGEKAADAARSIGLVCTTPPHGAKSPGKADWVPLRGHHVVVSVDHDEPGERYGADVAQLALAAGALAVKIIRLNDIWPAIPKGGDFADLIGDPDLPCAGRDDADIRAAVEGLADRAEAVKLKPQQTKKGESRLVLTCVDDVPRERVDWYWRGRIPKGKLTLLVGDPGGGKSYLSLDWAARTSLGKALPFTPEIANPIGSTIILALEDEIGVDIRPRLEAAGADLASRKVHVIEGVREIGEDGTRTFNIGRDIALLDEAIDKIGNVRLVVVDPVSDYLGPDVDTWKDGSVRAALSPLVELAKRLRIALIGIIHPRKAGVEKALHKILGSVAFGAVARAVWFVTDDLNPPSDADPEAEYRILASAKLTAAKRPPAIRFMLKSDVKHEPARVCYLEEINVTADDLIVPREAKGREEPDLVEWVSKRGGKTTVRQVTRYGPRPLRRDAERHLRELVEAGRGHWETVRNSQVFVLDDPDGDPGHPTDEAPPPEGVVGDGDTGDGDASSWRSGDTGKRRHSAPEAPPDNGGLHPNNDGGYYR